jgi:predicted transcriptional regulator
MDQDSAEKFVKNLQRLLKERDIDAAQLSEMTEIPLPSIERILDEISYPNKAAMERIADRLGISLQELIGEESPKPEKKETVEAISVSGKEKAIIEGYRNLPNDHWLRKAIEENLLDKSD